MSLFEEPRKAKAVFVITLILAIIFLLSSGVLGYFFYKKYQSYEDIWGRYTSLKKDRRIGSEEVEELKKQIEELNTQKTALETENKEMTDGIAVANAYNEFFKYMNSVIETHGGYSGWTENEYQTARAKAQATGSSGFVSTVDWAWHRTDIDPTTRILKVLQEIASGIENALK